MLQVLISKGSCFALHCNVDIYTMHTSKNSNQSAQYAWLGQWSISPFENVDTFD